MPPVKKVRIVPSILALVAGASLAMSAQQGQTPQAQWSTYGANLASQRYSPLDQINKDNFSKLQIAWRLKTNNLGPTPDNLYSATPLMVNGVLYTTAGTRRAVVALNPGTGEMLWMYTRGRGSRGQSAAAQRRGPGRVLLVQPRWRRPAHHLRDARIPDDRPEREHRSTGRRLRHATASST